jgi:hypothetical protein
MAGDDRSRGDIRGCWRVVPVRPSGGYQNAPAEMLPPPVRDDNPWRVPQRIDGKIRRTATRTRSAQ